MKRKKIKYLQRILSLMLSAALTIPLPLSRGEIGTVPVFAADPAKAVQEEAGQREADMETVRISSADDFQNFCKKALTDGYSKRKRFLLTEDIDISSIEGFRPAPVLSGIFDGGGHSISGFSFKGAGNEIGLFRLINTEGTVKNLTLKGVLSPKGGMEHIGSLAGINRGTIENCTTYGSVLGLKSTGGIAGLNESTGRISGCKNFSTVSGMSRTGGIVGFNEGLIEGCSNSGEVNNSAKTAWEIEDERKDAEAEATGDGEEIEDDSDTALENLIPDAINLKSDDILSFFENEQKINYTGGIAGASSGEVISCTNYANIGYPHLGYKTGGIVGYERGILLSCINEGRVLGRKNIGGIAGQLEPYMENIFHDDSFDRARTESDRLVNLISALQELLKGEDDLTQGNIDAIRATADELRGTVSGYRDYYRGRDDEMEADIKSHTDAVKRILDSIEPSLPHNATQNSLKALRNDLSEIDRLMSAAETAAGSGVTLDMGSYAGNISSITNDMLTQSDTMLKSAEKLGREWNSLRGHLESLRGETSSLDDFLRWVYDSYKSDFRATDEHLSSHTDTIAAEMDILNDSLKGSDSRIRAQMDLINENLQSLNEALDDSFDEVRESLEEIRNTENVNDIFDDISDNPDRSPGKGKIVECENRGFINADINGGGIAGMADTDLDSQSDFEIVSAGQVSFNYDRTKRASFISCINRGSVIVKNDHAGGITGTMDSGAVLDSQNFGSVQTLDGDYAGGIAGKSGYLIRNCFSMCTVSGNDYVGGIAGFAKELYDNKAMVDILKGSGEYIGAIAGDLHEEGRASGNIFISSPIAAINGLTFAKEAMAVDYGYFSSLPDMPDDIRNMRVTFTANGEILKEVMVPYGGSVSTDAYPKLPEIEGQYGLWEYGGLYNITQNTVVEGKYLKIDSTVASDEPFPVLLLSGAFYDGTALSYEHLTAYPPLSLNGYAMLDGISFHTESEHGKISENYVVRLLNDGYGEDAAAAAEDNGQLRILPTFMDGRYMVFPLEGKNVFYILRQQKNYSAYIIAAGAALALLLIIAIATVLKNKKSKKK